MTINQITSLNSSLRPLSVGASPQPQQALNSGPRTISSVQPEIKAAPASAGQVQQAVEEIQQTAKSLAQNLQFSIDEDTGITVIKVLDSQTQEVIRQIPTEEAVTIARTLDKVKGLLFSDQA